MNWHRLQVKWDYKNMFPYSSNFACIYRRKAKDFCFIHFFRIYIKCRFSYWKFFGVSKPGDGGMEVKENLLYFLKCSFIPFVSAALFYARTSILLDTETLGDIPLWNYSCMQISVLWLEATRSPSRHAVAFLASAPVHSWEQSLHHWLNVLHTHTSSKARTQYFEIAFTSPATLYPSKSTKLISSPLGLKFDSGGN
jgi:hypothetical protein